MGGRRGHTIWDHPVSRMLLAPAAAVLVLAVFVPIADHLFRDPVPHGVAIGTAARGPYPTIDPAKVIPASCPGVRKVNRLINRGWDYDKDGRKYQDYYVSFGSPRVDVARLYLDDGSVRCP